MNIKFKRLTVTAVEPRKATVGAAGFDLTATWLEDTATCYKYHTGIALELPPGWTALVFPRSSVVKKGAWMGNSVGVIDSDYRGEITVCFYNFGHAPYKAGERIAQLVIVPYLAATFEEADVLSDTERGEGGFGSTGRK